MRAADRRRSPRSARLPCSHLSMPCSRPRGMPSIWPAGKGSVRCGSHAEAWTSGGSTSLRWPSARRGIWPGGAGSAIDAGSTSSTSTTACRPGHPYVILCHKFRDRRLDWPAGDHRAERGRRHPWALPGRRRRAPRRVRRSRRNRRGRGPGRGLAAGTSAPRRCRALTEDQPPNRRLCCARGSRLTTSSYEWSIISRSSSSSIEPSNSTVFQWRLFWW
jgi:hypothetical protein